MFFFNKYKPPQKTGNGPKDGRGVQLRLLARTILVLWLLLLGAVAAEALCPTSACITVGVDDDSDIYINGNHVGVGTSTQCSQHSDPGCISVPVGYLTAGTNVIALTAVNTKIGYVWAAWDLDITNSDGTHTHVASTGSGITMYYQCVASSTASGCSALTAPANDTSSRVWYDPAYNKTTGFGPATTVTDSNALYCHVPATLTTALGYAANGGWDGVDAATKAPIGETLYFRQSFSITCSGSPTASRTYTRSPTRTPTSVPASPTNTFTRTRTPSPSSTPTPNCTGGVPTSATISFYGDNYITAYLNGNQLAAEQNGITTSLGLSPISVNVAWLNASPTVNILSFQVEDSANHAAGNFAGVTYDLAITFGAGCSVQHIISDGNCVKTRQSGTRAARSPPAGAWQTNAYTEDGTWGAVFSNTPCYCDSGCVFVSGDACPGANWSSLPGGVPWISQLPNFLDVTDKGSQLYRQQFQLGVNGCTVSTPTNTPSRTYSPTNSPTFSATRTMSPTPTTSPTPSATQTFSPTPTTSPTPSATATFSPTPTFSDSPTPSSTPTQSFTFTASPTPSSTATPTPTYTATPTFSSSPTPTGTPTHTPTYTPTPTNTPSPTFSDSPTQSFTFTGTNTYTGTTTFTYSPTMTPSGTATATYSGTVTFTDSPTTTPSGTPTATYSGTVTFSDSPTPSLTNTESYTYTPTQSFTETPTVPGTATDSPTTTESDTYTGTKTFTEPPTLTDSPTETPSFTESMTPSPSRTMTPSRTQSPTFSESPTQSATFTISQTLTPQAAIRVDVKVYNSAGELVAVLYQNLGAYQMPTQLSTLQGSFSTDGGQGALLLNGPDLTLVWDGSTVSGQKVTSGVYSVLVSARDPFGTSKQWIAQMSVISEDTSILVQVFNGAGELVWSERRPGAALTGLSLSRTKIWADTGTDGVKIVYGQGVGEYAQWTGVNSKGLAVATGTYYVKVSRTESGGASRSYTATVSVIQLEEGVFSKIVPDGNPVPVGQRSVEFTLAEGAGVTKAWGSVFSLTGEKIGSVSGPPTSLVWQIPSGVSSGICLVRITAENARGRSMSRTLKLYLLR